MKAARANAVDAAVGARIRNLRLRNGLSQTELGEQIGVTFQQIQKYEKGTNRISASRLAALAKFFGLPVAAFYSEVPTSDAKSKRKISAGTRLADANVDRLVKAFHRLKDKKLRAAILRVAEEMTMSQRRK
jgi:transcriptional regulator with XRE-family HTH domain